MNLSFFSRSRPHFEMSNSDPNTVWMVTLIFTRRRGWAIPSAQKGEQVLLELTR